MYVFNCCKRKVNLAAFSVPRQLRNFDIMLNVLSRALKMHVQQQLDETEEFCVNSTDGVS